MTRILLYWNHICVLHKQEKDFLEKLTDELSKEDIALEVRYFGLGYPMHMSEYLAKEDAILPDIIVSADLEVYEDSRIFSKFKDSLHPAATWMPLRDDDALNAVWRGDKLLPILSIPLVYYTKNANTDSPLTEQSSLAIGGVNNSAIKTIVKSVWERYGKHAADAFLSNCHIADMPIGAFQSVRQGAASTALVPSLYALRADNSETFLRIPEEGPLLIPSYLAVRNSIPESIARSVVSKLLSDELCSFYATSGDLLLHIDGAHGYSRQSFTHYTAPSAEWLSSVTPEEFYALYREKLPTAKDVFA